MTLAKRSTYALMVVFISIALGTGLLVIHEEAHALTSASTPYAAAKAVVKKSKDVKAKGEKIALAAATISYSRATYQTRGTVGTEIYYNVCKKYMGSYYLYNKKQMQCNVPVAAAVRFSGVDKKYPKSNLEMYTYMKKSKKWKCLGNYNGKTSSLKPGDVLIRIGGLTTYTDKYGVKRTASTKHACVYVGKKITSSVYKKILKGSEADMGKPGSKRVFVSAHTSLNNYSKRSAACMETAKQAYADYRMLVFRYVG